MTFFGGTRGSLFAAVACVFLLGACGSKEQPKEKVPPQAVTIATVQFRQVDGGLTASGRLVPREEMAVAADLSGYRIARVLVEEGAFVKAGQPLAILDDSLLVSQISQLRATLAQQGVVYEQARDKANRVSGIENEGVLSSEAVAERKFTVRNAAAARDATNAQLGDLLVRQAHMVIRAPEAGLVLERTARPGEPSSSGTTMFTMARDGLLELYAEMPEAAVREVRVGDPAKVTLASGRVLDGKVRLVGERVAETTGLVIARVALPVDPELRQGGFASAQFANRARILAVPEAAVHYDADGANVMAVDDKNRVRRIKVRTGVHSAGLVELREGPPAATRVAVKGAAFTLDGDQVTIAANGR